MSLRVNVQLNEEQLRTVRESLQHIPKAANKAIARAINRAIEGARADAVKAITQEYYVKAYRVHKAITLKKANPERLEAWIICSGSPLPLIHFHVRPSEPENQKDKKTVERTTVIAGVKFGSTETLPNAFVATMKSGHTGVFTRSGSLSLPIKQEVRLSIPQMLGNKNILEYIDKRVNERLDKELQRLTVYFFGGGR